MGGKLSGRFEGKVLLATGAGSGLAAATARRFAREGGTVAVVDIAQERADAVYGKSGAVSGKPG